MFALNLMFNISKSVCHIKMNVSDSLFFGWKGFSFLNSCTGSPSIYKAICYITSDAISYCGY